uniref:Uncharacterized protein n=1 Tax=Anguilla anguilla TaxID=7936 RepID=A0A0E9VVG4_ANGAN
MDWNSVFSDSDFYCELFKYSHHG